MSGYTVVDLETTGLFPGKHDRVVEIALIAVSDQGEVEHEWATLVNPERDVGPTHIHGISARDVLDAPTFREIAQHLVSVMAGRTLVAHNARFDSRFLDAEFDRAGLDTAPPMPALCTMEWSSSYARGASRKLTDCCQAVGVPHSAEHSALGDARAAAGLLRHYLTSCGSPVPWQATVARSRAHRWPPLDAVGTTVPAVLRGSAVARSDAWLDHITSDLPRNPDPTIEAYLDVLETAMIDRYLSAHEERQLIELAIELGLHRDQLAALHATYLDSLAIAAWEDGVVTEDEEAELRLVAAMLGLPAGLVPLALRRAAHARPADSSGFTLRPGDCVVFTGELSMPRGQWTDIATAAGLRIGNVTKSTTLVIAADPDSMSGKAAKARSYGVPVITEAAFARLLARLNT